MCFQKFLFAENSLVSLLSFVSYLDWSGLLFNEIGAAWGSSPAWACVWTAQCVSSQLCPLLGKGRLSPVELLYFFFFWVWLFSQKKYLKMKQVCRRKVSSKDSSCYTFGLRVGKSWAHRCLGVWSCLEVIQWCLSMAASDRSSCLPLKPSLLFTCRIIPACFSPAYLLCLTERTIC